MSTRVEQGRTGLRWLLAVVYFTVGVIHLRSPEAFLPIVPTWVPFPRETILATGVCEILGAVALMIPRLRWLAGVMLAAYAIAVFPANIKHAFEGVKLGGEALGWGYHGPRLAFQPVFVWWALFAGAVIDWPFRRKG
nr:DoxX family protein [Polymorphobacter sp.]